MKKLTLTFTREKDTKNAIRYQEVTGDNAAPAIGALYVQKWAAEGEEEIQVTIEPKAKKGK